MNERLLKIKELITLQEATEAELNSLIGGGEIKTRKTVKCSKCNEEGHTARTCTKTEETLPNILAR